MKRLALAFASVAAACTLAACGSGSGGSAASPTSTGPQPHQPYKTQKPGQWDSPGVVVANKDSRKVVLDKSLPVYDPPIIDGGVAQNQWPEAGRLLSIKELLGVFPDALQIAFNPQGPTKLVVTPQLSGDSNSKGLDPNTITITINDVGVENNILAGYDSKRASDRTIYTDAGGKPQGGRIYYKDGAFNTQRLSMYPDDGDTWDMVIGNGRTAMRMTVKYDGFISLYDSAADNANHVMEQQVMPLIFQLLAARM